MVMYVYCVSYGRLVVIILGQVVCAVCNEYYCYGTSTRTSAKTALLFFIDIILLYILLVDDYYSEITQKHSKGEEK